MSAAHERHAAAIARRPWTVVVLALLIAAAALPVAFGLRLDGDLLALLPRDSVAAADYRLFVERFGGFEKVFVILRRADAPAPAEASGDSAGSLIAAVSELESFLADSPEIAAVRGGLGDEEQAFLARFVVGRAPLLLGGDWRREVAARLAPEAVEARAARLRRVLRSPSAALESTFAIWDPLGFADGLDALGRAAGGLPIDPLSGIFLTPEGDAALLVLTPARAETDAGGGRALAAALDEAGDRLRRDVDPRIELLAVGGPLYAAQDEAILRGDLERTIAGSALGCAALLLLAFRGPTLVAAAFAAIAIALLVTAAAVHLVWGDLTAAGLGFAAVLIGLGVDYAIHGGTRYRERRLAGDGPAAALGATVAGAGRSILASALTTAAAFAVLTLAALRPLREVGLLIAVGILAILVATATLGAAFLVLLQRPGKPGALWQAMGSVVERIVGLAERRPLPVLAVAVVLAVGAAQGLRGLQLDADPASLRPSDHPALAAEELLASRFDVGLDTMTVVVPGADRDRVVARSAEVGRLLAAASDGRAEVSSPSDWLVSGGERRLGELAAMRFGAAAAELEAALRKANLDPRAFAPGLAALRAFADGRDPGAPTDAELPGALAEMVRRDAGGAVAAVRARLPGDLWPDGPPEALRVRLREAAPGAAVASAVALGAELRRLAGRDVRRLGWVAFALVALVVTIAVGLRPMTAGLALLPVLLGSLWAFGLWGTLGRPIDLFGLAVLPIVLGIGIDDGLHAVHGAAGGRRLAASVRLAGRAMTLTTLTTCIGFASLAFSRVPGLRNGGLLVSIGVTACWLATLWVLPALAAVIAGRASRTDSA